METTHHPLSAPSLLKNLQKCSQLSDESLCNNIKFKRSSRRQSNHSTYGYQYYALLSSSQNVRCFQWQIEMMWFRLHRFESFKLYHAPYDASISFLISHCMQRDHSKQIRILEAINNKPRCYGAVYVVDWKWTYALEIRN